jgi:NADPH:quinone reductase-like Zn-dependent oxidoreductase
MVRVVPDHPRPQPRPGEVLVRVRAASLNRHDLFTIHGMPGIKLPLPVVLGSDGAGEVAGWGEGVSEAALGQRVLIHPIYPGRGMIGELTDGCFAEYCSVDARQLIAIPEGVSFDTAAALPVAYGTAHRMLFTNGVIQPNDIVLVLGAGGGVGTCCVMLAKMHGCEVIACAGSDAKLDRLRALGADHVVNYNREDITRWVHARYGKPARRTDKGGVTVIVNYTGGDSWVPSLKALRRGGKLLTCGATAGFSPREDLRYVFMHELRIIGSNSMLMEDLDQLLRLCATGRLQPAIDGCFELKELPEALRRLEERESFGKILLHP